jgi:hypothetical protein
MHTYRHLHLDGDDDIPRWRWLAGVVENAKDCSRTPERLTLTGILVKRLTHQASKASQPLVASTFAQTQ